MASPRLSGPLGRFVGAVFVRPAPTSWGAVQSGKDRWPPLRRFWTTHFQNRRLTPDREVKTGHSNEGNRTGPPSILRQHPALVTGQEQDGSQVSGVAPPCARHSRPLNRTFAGEERHTPCRWWLWTGGCQSHQTVGHRENRTLVSLGGQGSVRSPACTKSTVPVTCYVKIHVSVVMAWWVPRTQGGFGMSLPEAARLRLATEWKKCRCHRELLDGIPSSGCSETGLSVTSQVYKFTMRQSVVLPGAVLTIRARTACSITNGMMAAQGDYQHRPCVHNVDGDAPTRLAVGKVPAHSPQRWSAQKGRVRGAI